MHLNNYQQYIQLKRPLQAVVVPTVVAASLLPLVPVVVLRVVVFASAIACLVKTSMIHFLYLETLTYTSGILLSPHGTCKKEKTPICLPANTKGLPISPCEMFIMFDSINKIFGYILYMDPIDVDVQEMHIDDMHGWSSTLDKRDATSHRCHRHRSLHRFA